uniref:KASH domain-containing protein n=1 Tax=Plectus sambesii TaxID=2011161 RepID=A0A914XFA2_9BILA
VADMRQAIRQELAVPLPSPAVVDDGQLMDDQLDIAADLLAAAYPDRDPMEVLRERGLLNDNDASDLAPVDVEAHDDADGAMAAASSVLSPIPDDPTLPSTAVAYDEDDDDEEEVVGEDGDVRVRQRSRWRRVLRTALPLQAMLVLLLGAACLVPHCDDDYSCQLLNNFARSFEPVLEFMEPPPF